MMISDLLKYVLRSMLKRATQSILTVLSIMMGIMAIFALLSFGQGLMAYVDTIAEDMGTDKLIAQPMGAGVPGSTGTYLSENDLDFIRKQKGVSDAAAFIFGFPEVRVDPDKKGKWVQVTGLSTKPDDIKFSEDALSAFDLMEGRSLKSGDTGKAVLGYNFAQPDKLFQKPLKIGDKIYINDMRFDVIGFYEEIGNPQDDANVIISLDDAEKVFDVKGEYGMIYIRAEKGKSPSELAEYLEEKLRKYKDQKEGQEDFFIITLESQLEMFNSMINVLNGILVLIAAVSVLVAAVNIMNTMYTAVMERTKEIGIVKAIGAGNYYILSIFVLESGILGLLGGLVGILFGYVVASIAGSMAAAAGYAMLQPAFPSWLIAGCLAFAVAVGLVSGFFPARQASKLRPVDALRYE